MWVTTLKACFGAPSSVIQIALICTCLCFGGKFSIPAPAARAAHSARELKILLFLASNESSANQIIFSFITVPPHQKATPGKFEIWYILEL